jgi:hypothetical protein
VIRQREEKVQIEGEKGMLDRVAKKLRRQMIPNKITVVIYVNPECQYVVRNDFFVAHGIKRPGRHVMQSAHGAAMKLLRLVTNNRALEYDDFSIQESKELGPNKKYFVIWFAPLQWRVEDSSPFEFDYLVSLDDVARQYGPSFQRYVPLIKAAVGVAADEREWTRHWGTMMI